MRLTLIENGLDSLRKGYESLNYYDNLLDSGGDELQKSFALKSAIIQTHHGIEILMKYILATQSEYLIFSNIDDNVKKAYKEKYQKGLNSVFETSVIDKVHTVTYSEAFERLTNICNHKFSKNFADKIAKLNLFRNRLTHAEISIDNQEIVMLFNELIDEIDIYFFEQIGNNYKTLSGYSDLINNYESYKKWLNEHNKTLKADAIDKLVAIFKKLQINMGINEVKRIQDIDLCTKLFEELYSTGFQFGTDLYNGTCSGHVSHIKRIDKNHFSLFCKDNGGEEIFKFKSIIIYNPEYNSDFSPIFILEADDDIELSDKEIDVKRENYCHKNTWVIDGMKISTEQEIIIDSGKLNDLYYRIDNEPIDFTFYHVTKHLSRSMFCMINIQGLNYGRFDQLISRGYTLDGADFERKLRKSLN